MHNVINIIPIDQTLDNWIYPNYIFPEKNIQENNIIKAFYVYFTVNLNTLIVHNIYDNQYFKFDNINYVYPIVYNSCYLFNNKYTIPSIITDEIQFNFQINNPYINNDNINIHNMLPNNIVNGFVKNENIEILVFSPIINVTINTQIINYINIVAQQYSKSILTKELKLGYSKKIVIGEDSENNIFLSQLTFN